MEKAKSKLLGLVDLSKFELCSDILIGGEVFRREDNTFEFEHQWLEGKDPALELEQDVYMDADFLWQHDLRNLEFKIAEKNRRRQERTLEIYQNMYVSWNIYDLRNAWFKVY